LNGIGIDAADAIAIDGPEFGIRKNWHSIEAEDAGDCGQHIITGWPKSNIQLKMEASYRNKLQ